MEMPGLSFARLPRVVFSVGVAALLGSLASPFHAFAETAWIEGFGQFGTGTEGYATDMSADGSVAVGGALTSGSDRQSTRPVIWSYGAGASLLNPIPTYFSEFRGLSDDGTIGIVALGGSSPERGSLWTSTGGLVQNMPTDVRSVLGISGNGTTVVGESADNRSMKWTQAGGTQILGPAGSRGYLNAANFDGSIVVGQYRANAITTIHSAAMWGPTNGTGTPTLLGSLGGSWSEAKSITSDGSVVVGMSQLAGDATYGAFRWTLETGMQDLGVLTPGDTYAEARYVSRNGAYIVGQSANLGTQASLGFVWSLSTGNMVSLVSYLESGNVDLTGWSYLFPTAITDDGRRIAGGGTYNGVKQGFVAQIAVPEPAAYAIALAGVACGGFSMWRRRRA